MKRLSVLLIALFLGSFQLLYAGNGNDKSKGEINWITFEEAEKLMQQEPKLVLIDVYTGWCGWCKVMDKKTYTNPDLIAYVNKHFYAIKFDAEQKEPVNFMGKLWEFKKDYKSNELAVEILQGRMSYPTTVIMGEGFKSVNPVPGYLQIPQMESVLRFFGDGAYKAQQWAEYQKNFQSEWVPEN